MSASIKRRYNTELINAFSNLDEIEIRMFMRKWGIEIPRNEEIFWRMVHKAITAKPGFPMALREKSKAWLLERGSQSFDGGDIKAEEKQV